MIEETEAKKRGDGGGGGGSSLSQLRITIVPVHVTKKRIEKKKKEKKKVNIVGVVEGPRKTANQRFLMSCDVDVTSHVLKIGHAPKQNRFVVCVILQQAITTI